MKQLVRQGIAKLFRSIGGGPGTGSSYKELGSILAQAKQGSDEAFQILQQKLADIGVSLKNKADLMNEEAVELNAALDDGINFVSEYFQKLTGGGIAKRGKGIAYKHGGHVKSMGKAKRGGGIAKR